MMEVKKRSAEVGLTASNRSKRVVKKFSALEIS